MYPPIFKQMFRKAFGDIPTTQYNPAISVDSRTGSWIYWAQTSPAKGFVAFKLFPEIATIVPFLAPYMSDVILQPIVRQLQTDSYIAAASKILFGQVEFIKDSQSKVKDALTLSPETLGKFLMLLKSGLSSVIKIGAAPLANTSAIEFTGDTNLYDSYLSTSAASTGINSRLIYSKDRQNLSETRLSMDIDQNVLRPVYSQFENFLEYQINQRTKKYKFKFMLEGFENYLSRDDRFDKAMKLASIGIVLPQKFASAMSMSPFDMEAMMAEGRANEWALKLTPLMASAQMSANSSGGRPSKPEGQLSDSGAETQESGSNEEKAQE